MTIWASGVKAWAICDRCGFRYKYAKIRTEPGTNMRVCYRCLDPVPLGQDIRKPQGDPYPLEFPRPDIGLVAPSLWGTTGLKWGSTQKTWGSWNG